MQRDANTKGGALNSGTSTKQGFHDTKPASLGMGHSEKSQKPQGNPAHKVRDGHTIK